MKTKMQLTLSGWDAELLEEATRVSAHHTKDDAVTRDTRQWLVKWAIRAVARAVIGIGGLPIPTAAQLQLRFEGRPETEARALLRSAKDWDLTQASEQIVVLAEGLERHATYLRAIVHDRNLVVWSAESGTLDCRPHNRN